MSHLKVKLWLDGSECELACGEKARARDVLRTAANNTSGDIRAALYDVAEVLPNLHIKAWIDVSEHRRRGSWYGDRCRIYFELIRCAD